MGLLVYRLHLDVGLTQGDPASTWKQNTARLNAAGHANLCFHELGGASSEGTYIHTVERKLYVFGLLSSILHHNPLENITTSRAHADRVFVLYVLSIRRV